MMLSFKIAVLCWLLSLVWCAVNRSVYARLSLMLGCGAAIVGVMLALPAGTVTAVLPWGFAGQTLSFHLDAAALWLCGFGLVPALCACWVAGLTQSQETQRGWLAGTGCALLGALGVFGLQDGVAFLIAWELMSFGVAAMLLAEHKSKGSGVGVFFMMALLEVGAIALVVAFLLLSGHGGSFAFATFAQQASFFTANKQFLIGILLLIGFGAKLGLLPFYEWLSNAYAAGSGATGAIASGVILNAAFYALMRGVLVWLPLPSCGVKLGVVVVFIGALTALLTILYAFQQSDWRRLLSYSSAENAAISVLTLGMALLFRQEQQADLAALAGVVALLHLAGHSLAKGALFLAADGVFCATRSYAIKQNGVLKKLGGYFGIGALFATMSLAAMPPQAGFVSEWYVFQTIFHGFHLTNLVDRYALIGAGVALALTAAISLASFVKLFGVGLLGANSRATHVVSLRIKFAVFVLGLAVLVYAVGMLRWIDALNEIALDWFHFSSPAVMHSGWLLVPLSADFAFISPALLVIVMPLLALIPILLVLKNTRYAVKRVPIWYGGLPQERASVATTALTFSNAMHYFYRFIYLPKHEVKYRYHGKPYFIKSVTFNQHSTALFRAYLFKPIVSAVVFMAEKIRLFQSGNLNFYNAIIGFLLIVILLSVLFGVGGPRAEC